MASCRGDGEEEDKRDKGEAEEGSHEEERGGFVFEGKFGGGFYRRFGAHFIFMIMEEVDS